MDRDDREANLGRVRELRQRLRERRAPSGEPPASDTTDGSAEVVPLHVVREPTDGEAMEAPDDRWTERADLR